MIDNGIFELRVSSAVVLDALMIPMRVLYMVGAPWPFMLFLTCI